MLKPTFLNICISILVSYIIFLGIPMIMNGDYRLLEFSNIQNGTDLFLYLWLILFFPIVDIILFSAPLYFSFKIKNRFSFILSVFLIFSIEYFIYAYFTSEKIYDQDGLQKVTIGIIIFILLFYKTIRSKFTE